MARLCFSVSLSCWASLFFRTHVWHLVLALANIGFFSCIVDHSIVMIDLISTSSLEGYRNSQQCDSARCMLSVDAWLSASGLQ